MTGIYYYKLVSNYSDDITVNCKLSINQIDSNFYNLKSADIKDVKLSEDGKYLIVTRNDDKEFVTEMPYVQYEELYETLEGAMFNQNIEWDKDAGIITITWEQLEDGEMVEHQAIIDGLITETDVKTNNTLIGNGSNYKPLRLNPIEQTGFYRPVISIIDTTSGDTLPENPSRDDRYVTIENVSKFGYIYTFDGAQEIASLLSDEESDWRIPSKADWDKLLDSVETCECGEGTGIICHDSDVCHKYLGFAAGKILKSVDYWQHYTGETYVNEDGLEVNPIDPTGIDTIGFTVLPSGNASEDGVIDNFKKRGEFWTSTHIKTPEHPEGDPDQDIYVKIFDYRKASVLQEALCPDEYISLRLVKDYNGSNDFGYETILGSTYETLHVNDTMQIWTKVNISYPTNTENSRLVPNGGEDIDIKKVYFLNVFDGEKWYKKALVNGDTVIVNNGEQYENEEIRIFEDENGNQHAESTDDVVFERVMDHIEPILDDINERLENEISERQEVDAQLWDAINQEASARTETDNQLWSAINTEAELRERIDNEQWAAINAETQNREAVDQQLWNAINTESETREQIDNQQWEAINNEAITREAEDNRISAALEQETRDRIEIDNQQWEAINDEIARAKSEEKRIEDQLIDNTIDYVLNVNSGNEDNLVLKSKGGTNDVAININFDFGEL